MGIVLPKAFYFLTNKIKKHIYKTTLYCFQKQHHNLKKNTNLTKYGQPYRPFIADKLKFNFILPAQKSNRTRQT